MALVRGECGTLLRCVRASCASALFETLESLEGDAAVSMVRVYCPYGIGML